MTDTLALRLAAAETIARNLGRLALSYFADQSRLSVSMKGAQDWLTAADGAVEAAFRDRIAAIFPGDAVMGEEMGGGNADALWIIDPIDGTANFAHGDRMWCISIGFLDRGTPALGIVYAPALDEMFVARKGHGATLNGAPIKPAATDDIKRAALEIGWSTRRPFEEYFGRVEAAFRAGAHVKRCASGAMGLVYCACGRTDGYYESHINAWDVAAGVVIAAEAGAYVSNFFDGPGVLASGNPILALAPGIVAEARRVLQV
jgi:myo-inositol-1(or 4)-monophosphatase